MDFKKGLPTPMGPLRSEWDDQNRVHVIHVSANDRYQKLQDVLGSDEFAKIMEEEGKRLTKENRVLLITMINFFKTEFRRRCIDIIEQKQQQQSTLTETKTIQRIILWRLIMAVTVKNIFALILIEEDRVFPMMEDPKV
jgi:hypothetical protein